MIDAGLMFAGSILIDCKQVLVSSESGVNDSEQRADKKNKQKNCCLTRQGEKLEGWMVS